MGCDCGKPKCDGHCGASPAVLQINNPGGCVLFHKVEVPASMGDSVTNPPKPGAYKNVLLYYKADGEAYLYSSDGMPTKVTGVVSDYACLENKPQINGVTLEGDKSLEDLGITDAIDDALEDYTPTSEFAEVAFTGDYDDLIGTPTIPVVNDATLTITQNGTTLGTFSANQSTDETIDITGGGRTTMVYMDYAARIVYSDSAKTVPLTGQDVYNLLSDGCVLIEIDGTYRVMAEVNDADSVYDVTFSMPWAMGGTTWVICGYRRASDTIFVKEEKNLRLIAGANIQINANNIISATDTTYSAFTGATSSVAGGAGLVPAPAAGDQGKFLQGDGTWAVVQSGPTVVQTTGQSTTDVMSQKAVTDIIGDVETILQTLNSGTGAQQ